MVYIKKLKLHKILEITFWCFVMLGTYFIWNFETFEHSAGYYFDHSIITLWEDPTYENVIYSVSDLYQAHKLPKYHLVLENGTYRDEAYQLYLGISKTISQENLRIFWKEDVSLRDLYRFEDERYFYYLMDQNHLKAGIYEYDFILWNKATDTNLTNYTVQFLLEKM